MFICENLTVHIWTLLELFWKSENILKIWTTNESTCTCCCTCSSKTECIHAFILRHCISSKESQENSYLCSFTQETISICDCLKAPCSWISISMNFIETQTKVHVHNILLSFFINIFFYQTLAIVSLVSMCVLLKF